MIAVVDPSPLPLLTLPLPEHPFAECAADRSPVCGCATAVALPAAPAEPSALARHRWVLGHQLSFCVWRLMCENLAAGAAAGRDELSRGALLFDVYSALLIYTGSCTPEIYHTAVRPWMTATSPAFSGTRARGYERVLTVVGGPGGQVFRDAPEPARPEIGAVRAAMAANRRVHMAMAMRLVPSGQSLLREAGRRPDGPPTDPERAILDAFFRTEYRPTCRTAFASQVWDRVTAALTDLTRSPLPPAYDSGPAAAFQPRITELLCALAVMATAGAGQPPRVPLTAAPLHT